MQIQIDTQCLAPRPVEVVRMAGEPVRLVESPFEYGRATYDPLERRDPRLWEAVVALGRAPSPEECAAFATLWGFLGRRFLDPRSFLKDEELIRRGQAYRDWLHASILPPICGAAELLKAATTRRLGDLPAAPPTAGDLQRAEEAGTLDALTCFEIRRDRKTGGYHALALAGGKLYSAPAKSPKRQREAVRWIMAAIADRAMPTLQLRCSRERGVYGVADSLLGCAWIQLLEDAAVKDGGECSECGGWMLFDPRNRRGKQFCSVKCRVAAHRRKHGRRKR